MPLGKRLREDDGEPIEEEMSRLVPHLCERWAEGARLDAAIASILETLGFWDR